MACLGHYVAITGEQRELLLSLPDDESRLTYIAELDGQLRHREIQPVEKAWDAIHRCLTGDSTPDGLNSSAGVYPLSHCVLGGRPLYTKDDYIIRLIEPHVLKDLSAALESIDDAWMRRAYHKTCKNAWLEYGDEDCGYTLGWFQDLKYFLRRAAMANRAVVFVADQ